MDALLTISSYFVGRFFSYFFGRKIIFIQMVFCFWFDAFFSRFWFLVWVNPSANAQFFPGFRKTKENKNKYLMNMHLIVGHKSNTLNAPANVLADS